eukprot:TRINITY_DN16870_c1_g1_i1.p1 TRINITY_DN16870_c1_g1~~TRINITY_DN16870_c1_g1_i1.p1  ORF type:complete len:408 (-),score=25.31 TRINITY_DN16870_c1_g1_i1:63-1112(-)
MIPDRYPRNQHDGEGMDFDTWTTIRAAILERLNDVKNGLAENFCWVSHEEILSDEGRIVEGGLAVVVEKLTAFRINFYRMQEFRTWVNTKQLDIGSNKRFSEEQDIWVVRLTDESHASRTPLPRLDGERPQNRRAAVTPARFERLLYLINFGFVRDMRVPQVGQEYLINSLATQANETFAFRFRVKQTTFTRRWRWEFLDMPQAVSDTTVLNARSRFFRRRKWTVSTPSSTDLFVVRSSRDRLEHKLVTLASAQTLFVIRVETTSRPGFLPGQFACGLSIFRGEDDTVLYSGEVYDSPPKFIVFFRGSERELDSLVGITPVHPDGNASMYVSEFSDTALLLVAAGLILA